MRVCVCVCIYLIICVFAKYMSRKKEFTLVFNNQINRVFTEKLKCRVLEIVIS